MIASPRGTGGAAQHSHVALVAPGCPAGRRRGVAAWQRSPELGMAGYDSPDGRPPMPEWAVAATLMLVAFGIYANTLHAGFTFDDNFAVLNNKDVMDPSIPLANLLEHDFWGQHIAGDMSHKSYRPLTVLSFRTIRSLGAGGAVSEQGQPAPERQGGPNPFPFHLANAALHALVTYLVYCLAYELAVVRVGLKMHSSGQMLEMLISNQMARSAQLLQAQQAGRVASGPSKKQHTVVRKGSSSKRASTEEVQAGMALDLENTLGAMWLVQCGRMSSRCQREAVLAAVLFALHPVHCEAVAGIVGHAELLSAAFALLGLVAFVTAVKSRELFVLPSCQQQYGRQDAGSSQTGSSSADTMSGEEDMDGMSEPQPDLLNPFAHWVLVLFAAACCWAAALAKEIGITVAGSMLLFDILLVPIEAVPTGVSDDARARAIAFRSVQWRRKLARAVLLVLTTVGYIKMRNFVAGDHLVRIYRKVENPIAFASSWETRWLTTGYLHAKYASLLVFPLELSADWSFACIPYVEELADPRNLMTAALYAVLLWLSIASQPWEILVELFGRSRPHDKGGAPTAMFSLKPAEKDSGSSQTLRWYGVVVPRLHAARWRLFAMAALVVAPYFPASNVLFYVGTFIGERLLYFPSVGYCILLAYLLDSLGTSMSPTTSSHFPPCEVSLSQKMSTANPSGKPVPMTMVDVTQTPKASGAAAAPPAGTIAGKAGGGAAKAAKPTPASSARSIPVASHHNPDSLVSMIKSIACITLVSAILLGYGVRCSLRNRDWESEETLFRSAGQVCGASAKVQLNLGILMRRKFSWNMALGHFRAARTIEPSYCEPTYWYGLTLINQGQHMDQGIKELEKAIACKYVANEAVQALNTIYKVMHESNPMDGRHLMSWAQVLLRPEVGRPFEACNLMEQAALLAVTGPVVNITKAKAAGNACLKASLPTPESGLLLPAGLSAQGAASVVDEITARFARLKECVKARMKVLKLIHLSSNDVKLKTVKAAMYSYLMNFAAKCRAPITALPQPPVKGEPTLHMQLVHRVQAVDAEDAWLQREWGEILLLDGRHREAATHMEVAAMLLLSQLKSLTGGSSATLLAENGTGLVLPIDSARAALGAFDKALQLGPSDTCRTQYNSCETHLLLVQLLGGGPEAMVERKAAKERIRQLYLVPACRSYSRLLSNAFTGGPAKT
eukprot:jgi/Tetstr1/437503/TSEL_026182.t1